MDHCHQGLRFTVLHLTLALPGYIMIRGAWSCPGPAKASFLLRIPLCIEILIFPGSPFSAKHLLTVTFTGECTWDLVPVPPLSSGADIQGATDTQFSCCGVFSPCDNPFLMSAIWPETGLMYKEIWFLHDLQWSMVTQPNAAWRETDGWEKSIGSCKLCDKHWVSYFPAGLFLGQLGCMSFLPLVWASSVLFILHCSHSLCEQQVIQVLMLLFCFFGALQVASWNHFYNFIYK